MIQYLQGNKIRALRFSQPKTDHAAFLCMLSGEQFQGAQDELQDLQETKEVETDDDQDQPENVTDKPKKQFVSTEGNTTAIYASSFLV